MSTPTSAPRIGPRRAAANRVARRLIWPFAGLALGTTATAVTSPLWATLQMDRRGTIGLALVGLALGFALALRNRKASSAPGEPVQS